MRSLWPCSDSCTTSSFPSQLEGKFGGTVSPFRAEQGTSLETPSRARASSCQEVGTTWFFSSCGGILELRRRFQASSCVGPGKPKLPFELRGKAGCCARITARPKRPHLGVCGARGGFLPRHDEDLREPLVRRQGSQVSMRVGSSFIHLIRTDSTVFFLMA